MAFRIGSGEWQYTNIYRKADAVDKKFEEDTIKYAGKGLYMIGQIDVMKGGIKSVKAGVFDKEIEPKDIKGNAINEAVTEQDMAESNAELVDGVFNYGRKELLTVEKKAVRLEMALHKIADGGHKGYNSEIGGGLYQGGNERLKFINKNKL